MGTLVAKAYPTNLLLRAADHTYVECQSGAVGWGCWGGKTGGQEIARGDGSTKQADAIADCPQERAGITCYLVNGVCHQAANRVMFPAKRLVLAARGYAVSSAIFGPYGRVGVWPCSAPFNSHMSISGDLMDCLAAALYTPQTIRPNVTGGSSHTQVSSRDAAYFDGITAMYRQLDTKRLDAVNATAFHRQLFELDINYRLGSDILTIERQGLFDAKDRVEENHSQLTAQFVNEQLSPAGYIAAINELTDRFQDDTANALTPARYRLFMAAEPEDRIVLADPDIIAELYGQQVMEEVYPELGGNTPRPKF